MEIWEKPPSSHYRHPSFSSSLLDQIYRSIDNSSPLDSTIIKQKKQKRNTSHHENHHKLSSPLFHRQSLAADFEGSRRRTSTDFLKHSNSGSSDSSGGFSSSSFSSSSDYASPQQRKPIRTSSSLEHSSTVQKPKELGGFLRTKTKALKIYSDLKKVKQPISPGGRLATFLNSLFTTTATKPKKTRTTSVAATISSSSTTTTTTCSSASSFSRSCLSKTPTSSCKSKRSVRFCPVNVILDEDTSSSVHIPYPRLYEPKRDVVEEHRRVIEAAKDLLRTYHNNKTTSDETINDYDDDDDDDDDDAASCASSDLFELENLSAIGIDRYREELPVYETTRLDNTNRAIATRYIV